MPNAFAPPPPPPPSAPRPILQRRKSSGVSQWLWLAFAVVTLLCFVVTEVLVNVIPFAVLLMWVPFVIGILLLLPTAALACVGLVRLLHSPSRKSGVLSLCALGTGIGAIWALVRSARAMWAGAKTTALLGLILAAMNPWGAMVICALASLSQRDRTNMQTSVHPEWRMIRVEYAGPSSAGSREGIAFTLTNTGPHAIAEMQGELHVWDANRHAQVETPVNPSQPLEPNASITLSFPLDETGRQIRDIIESPQLGDGNDLPEIREGPGLRYQLTRFTDSSGEKYEVRSGNVEPKDGQAFFGFRRDLTNAEWRLVDVTYLGTRTQDYPGRATFAFELPADYSLARVKGKLQVIDAKDGHVERPLELTPPPGTARGGTVVYALPAGEDSELADRIITSREAYDRRIGNDRQTNYILRFQLQEMQTTDGKKYSIDFLGDLKQQ